MAEYFISVPHLVDDDSFPNSAASWPTSVRRSITQSKDTLNPRRDTERQSLVLPTSVSATLPRIKLAMALILEFILKAIDAVLEDSDSHFWRRSRGSQTQRRESSRQSQRDPPRGRTGDSREVSMAKRATEARQRDEEANQRVELPRQGVDQDHQRAEAERDALREAHRSRQEEGARLEDEQRALQAENFCEVERYWREFQQLQQARYEREFQAAEDSQHRAEVDARELEAFLSGVPADRLNRRQSRRISYQARRNCDEQRIAHEETIRGLARLVNELIEQRVPPLPYDENDDRSGEDRARDHLQRFYQPGQSRTQRHSGGRRWRRRNGQ